MKKFLLLCCVSAAFAMLDAVVVPGMKYPELLPEAQIMSRPASRARWIWYAMRGRGGSSRNDFLRTWITLDEAVKSAKLNMIFEKGILYINGQMVPRLPDTRPYRVTPVYSYDIAKFLKPGRNLIAAGRPDETYFNNCRPLMMHGEIELVSGKKVLLDSMPDMFKIGRNMKNWHTLDFDDSKLRYAKSLGDVLSPPEYLQSFVVECMTTEKEYAKIHAAQEKSLKLPESLASEPEADVKVVFNGGTPGIKVAGNKILPPVLLIMKTAGTDTYDDMILRAYGAGVRLFQLVVKFDDLPYDPETGKYDYRDLDRYVRRVLNLAPDAYIMVCVWFRGEWQKRLLEKYPDDAVGFASNPTEFFDDDIKACKRLSFASKIRREKIREGIMDLGKYVQNQLWRKRIMAVRVTGGVYTEWSCFGMANDMPDTGKAMTRAFRAYLKRLYKTDSALQKAYHDPNVTLDTILPPDHTERVGSGNYLRNYDSPERKVIDFTQCMCYERDTCLIDMVLAAKAAFPGTITGSYYGYVCSPTYPPLPGNTERILQESGLDFLSRPYNYDGKTRLAGGSGLHAHAQAAAHRYGKMTFIEADIRTHLVFASKNWQCRSPEETRAVVSRDLGNMITNGAGIQFYAVNDHFEYPAYSYSPIECIEPIATAIKIWKEAFDRQVTVRRSPIAVIHNMQTRFNGMPTVKEAEISSAPWVWDTYRALSYTGRSFDILDLKSFLLSDHNYNLVIFAETFSLDPATRQALRKKLDRPDTAAFWVYAPGLNSPENGFAEKNMLESCGIKLKLYPADKRYPMEMMVGSTRYWHRNYNSGEAFSEGIRVYADDPEAVVVGKWMDDQRPSFVLKQLPNGGISIFSGTAVTGSVRWMKIFDALGIPALADGETYVSANSHYLNIPLAENQSTVVRLPGKRFVRDLWSNQVLTVYGDTVTLPGGKPRSYLLEIDKPLDYSVKLNTLALIAAKLSGVSTFDQSGVLSFNDRNSWQSVIPFVKNGIFGTPAAGREMIGTRFMVNTRKKYRLTGEFRVTGVPGDKLGNFYFGFVPYAENNRMIAPEMIRPMDTGIYFLAKNAKAGDTQLTVRNADWQINTAHMCVAFNAKGDLSDLPNFDLSPRIKKGSAKNGSDGTLSVTLSAPLKSAYPAGTAVRLHSADAMYIYTAGKGAELTGQWQTLSGVISGEALRGAASDQWWHGTKSAAVIFRYAGKAVPGGVIEFRNVTVKEL